MHKICPSILKISERVLEAIAHNRPIVALQSTIISHGMPYPQNKQCAISIEKKVQEQGAVPATVAIFDGKIHVGLQQSHIEKLAYTGTKVRKVSRRDLPFILANKGIGATTVSATMIAAHAAGIDLFVTGGIGGVHRGFQHTMDVSADLEQLGRTPVTVVSAGVKSILDIPRTLQYLQTKGVPVITYKSKYFPAFFSSSSGLLSPFSVQSQLQAAKIIYSNQQLGFENGLLIGVPNNNPAQGQQIQNAINQAIKQSQTQKITGASITPFLLKRVNQLTKGKSLKSNISLVHNNAQIGSKIAVQLARLKQETREKLSKVTISMSRSQGKLRKCGDCGGSGCGKCQHNNPNKQKQIPQINPVSSKHTQKQEQQSHDKKRAPQLKPKGKLIAIGGSAIDYQITAKQGKFQLYKSCIGKTRKSLGGIARNIIECASKLGIQTTLISAVGQDKQSNIISQFCQKNKVNFVPIRPELKDSSIYSTGKYYAIMDHNNNQLLGISQMQINQIISLQSISNKYFNQIKNPTSQNNTKKHPQITAEDIIVLDSNIPQQQLLKIAEYCSKQFGCTILYQAKGQKTKRIITSGAYAYINVLKINYLERLEIQKAVKQLTKNSSNIDLNLWLFQNIGKNRSDSKIPIKCITTNGKQDIQIIQKQIKNSSLFIINKLKTPKSTNIKKTTGAGDTFTGAFCSMLLYGYNKQQALQYALVASKINIQTPVKQSVISDMISLEELERVRKSFFVC